MNLRTANHNHKRAERSKALREAFEFDMKQLGRLGFAGLLKRHNSGFVRRLRARAKALRRQA